MLSSHSRLLRNVVDWPLPSNNPLQRSGIDKVHIPMGQCAAAERGR